MREIKSVGKIVRLNRLRHPKTGLYHIFAMDHGGYSGPLKGIEDPVKLLREVFQGGATAFLLQRGLITKIPEAMLGRIGVILRVSGNIALSGKLIFETLSASPREAVKLGADAVVFSVHIGGRNESEAIKFFGKVVDECGELGIPAIGEFVPAAEEYDAELIRAAARIGAELGADLIKTVYAEPFGKVVDSCPAPIVLAGGPKTDLKGFLEMIRSSLDAGAAGICVGRNVFQYEDPRLMTEVLAKMVHENLTVGEALEILEEKRR
ncbi:MAG: fructose-bisphosphate aldolase [Thaumarchaeota archaeon]|nr:fructose-bisphosphate aldolase [Nitrososphaerota archaeon]